MRERPVADPLSTPRWQACWHALGAHPEAGLRERLLQAWCEPARHYHTLRHLEECFALLEGLRGHAVHPAEVEIALWFHDAVYDARRADNEVRSAEWARLALQSGGASREACERVVALVLATAHDAVPAGADACVLVDIDLAILGAPPARFDEYERQVREEYAWVSGDGWRSGRRAVLEGFLSRDTIYALPAMRAAREAQARANVQRALARL